MLNGGFLVSRGRFLKCVDLNGKRVEVIVEKVESEELNGKKKLVLSFKDRKKSLALNKTNANIIADSLGRDAARWCGQAIILSPGRVSFQGTMVDSVVASVPAPPASPDGADEAIPF
jgi:hypothetical protein